ncbi:uncharacterized protein [Dermacentor albipictus]|uniref:uncharacterized protein isoform X7 n=1 Tax=Dermacentor albipictus TaxID=60249 RepID=UPI0031FD57A0
MGRRKSSFMTKAQKLARAARFTAGRTAHRQTAEEGSQEEMPETDGADGTPESPCSPSTDKQAAVEEETSPRSPPPGDASAANASEGSRRETDETSAAKMATPTIVSRVFDIDKDDPDSWCTVGLVTNSECHQTILTAERGIKSFCDLPAVEQTAITSRLGTDDVQTVCFHHRRFYLYAERHKQGCLDRLLQHNGDQPLDGQIKVTSQLAESCRDIVELEEGELLCKVCVGAIKSKQDSSSDAPPRRSSFAFILNSKKYQDRAKRIDDIVTRCSVGIMTRSLCHMTSDTFDESISDFTSLAYGTAKALVSRIGRTFENICMHHERLYLEGYGAPCFDPENKHNSQVSSGQKWLVPRRFALVCRGRYPLRPGRTVCMKCLRAIRSKYPDIDAFYKEDEKEIQLKLAQLAESKPEDTKSDQLDVHTQSDGENSSQKDDSNTRDGWKLDRLGRRRRNITTTERQLRNLRVENPEFSDVLSSLDVQSQHREKRRVTKKVKSFDAANYKARPQRHYNARGIHIKSNKDACDCLQDDCPGCHFPCPKCGSQKCGDECRCNRNYVYEQIEVEGHPDVIFMNSLLA